MRVLPFVYLAACANAALPDLRARTQEMYDALPTGNRGVWDRALAATVVYTGEDGEMAGKAAVLEQIAPMPAGISGHIALQEFKMHPYRDVIVTTYVADEHEQYFGHELHARYRSTDTWHLDHTWQIIAEQTIALLSEPPSITSSHLEDYAGTYSLSADQHYVIRRDGDTLYAKRNAHDEVVLHAEAPDVFFVSGQLRTRKIFLRDKAGKVTGFVERREGEDVPWKLER